MDNKSDGFTLVELIVVIAKLGMIAAITLPRISGFKSITEESVCAADMKTFERMYSAFLVEHDIEHKDSLFDQFVIENFDEVCPTGGVISYEGGKVKCRVHVGGNKGEEDEETGEEVPWLWYCN